jgi:outer membrane protein assembly factor BamA
MSRAYFLPFAAGLAACLCVTASAQKFLPKNIVFKGDPEYSDAELLAASGLKKGEALSVADMNGHFKQLMDTGMFDNVLYKFDGVDLLLQLTPATILYSIRLDNLPLAPGKDLDAQLRARFPLYHGKVPPQGGMLDGVQHALEDLLAAQGIKATVTVTPFGTPGTKDVSAMSFSVASPPILVGAIQLDGVSAEMQAKVKTVADHTTGTQFNTENSEQNLKDAFQSFYVENGYAAAKVQVSRSGAPVIASDSVAIPFSVSIQEGKVYKLGGVHLSSNDVVSQDEIDKIVLGVGKYHTVIKATALRTVLANIAMRYKSKGYLDLNLTPHPQFDEAAGEVTYMVNADPGPVYHLAFVKFENVSDDLRKLLMRNWQMLPGDAFDESYVSNFVTNMQKSDPVLQRTLVGVKPTFDVRADPQTHEVNVVIRLQRGS